MFGQAAEAKMMLDISGEPEDKFKKIVGDFIEQEARSELF